MTEDNINDIASKSLGSANSYATFTDKFDSSLINPMPRSLARDDWGITGEEFVGYDVWHCHEATFLTDKGLPVAGTLKFIYPADSKYMIESKSAKLYLNSFDMARMGSTVSEAKINYIEQVKKDLCEKLDTDVQVNFFASTDYSLDNLYQNFAEYVEDNILDLASLDLDNEEFTDYNASEYHLKFNDVTDSDLPVISGAARFCGTTAETYYTNALRSRCRHTKQKDTGSMFVTIDSVNKTVDPLSLLKHVVSLREVNEFHEFCCEKMFCDLQKGLGSKDELMVAMLYSRRGSLDINPIRATSRYALHYHPILDIRYYTEKVQGQ